MPSICHQMSNSQMYHWKIVVRLSSPVKFSYTDQNITMFMEWRYDVWVGGETLTQITRLLIDPFQMPKQNTAISLSLCLSASHSLSLLLSLSVLPPLALSPPALIHTVSTTATVHTWDYWANLLQIFPLWRPTGEIPLVLTEPVGLLEQCVSGLSVLLI